MARGRPSGVLPAGVVPARSVRWTDDSPARGASGAMVSARAQPQPVVASWVLTTSARGRAIAGPADRPVPGGDGGAAGRGAGGVLRGPRPAAGRRGRAPVPREDRRVPRHAGRLTRGQEPRSP